MKDFFKEVSSYQYSSHINSTAVSLKSVNRYNSLS